MEAEDLFPWLQNRKKEWRLFAHLHLITHHHRHPPTGAMWVPAQLLGSFFQTYLALGGAGELPLLAK
jgi:hypothetical protein